MKALQRIGQILTGFWLVTVTSANTFALAQPSALMPSNPTLLAQANLAPASSGAFKPLAPVQNNQASAASKSTAASTGTPAVTAPGAITTSTPQAKPFWQDLTPAQQQSLKPLAANWATIGEGQKRKWLALSNNYPTMAPAEQAKLHSRMSDWATMSQQQRNQARLNFAETKTLTPDEKAANWKAYQALSPEEKQKLAAQAPRPPTGATAAVKPVPAQKLATVPKTRKDPKASEVAANSAKVDQRTLLPISPQGAVPSSAAPASPATQKH